MELTKKIEQLLEILENKYKIDINKLYSTKEATHLLSLNQIKLPNWCYDLTQINYLIKTWKIKALRKWNLYKIPWENILLYLAQKKLNLLQD